LRDEADRSSTHAALDHLRSRQLLLVLDNCDRTLTEVAHLTDTILRQSPGVRILVTSRENLGITGEAPYPVPPLSLPTSGDTSDELDRSEAVTLFVARATAVSPGFTLTDTTAAAVAGICRRLDGIPLALELAAARVKVLSVEAIARRLDNRFRLLTGGSKTSVPHHRTLRDSIDWSHDQLEEDEQRFFRRLCVFAGGWSLDAAEAVCAGDGVESWEALDVLSRLVDKSLVEMAADTDGDTERARYRMLETIREYAGARLEAGGDEAEIRERHRHFYRDLAVEAHPHLLAGGDLESWLSQFDREQENMRLAIDTALATGDTVCALAITASLTRYLQLRGHWSEGRTLGESVLDAPGARSTPSTELAQVLHRVGGLAQAQNDAPAAHAYYDESIRVWEELGEEHGLAGSLNNKGLLCMYEGQYDAARRLYEQALEINRRLGNEPWEASNLVNLGIIAADHGDFEEARDHYERGLSIARQRDDFLLQAVILDNLATVYRNDENMARARELHEESLEIYRRLGHRKGIATTLTNLGTLTHGQGDLDAALLLLKESLRIKQEIGDRRGMIYALESLASLITDLGHPDRGARLFGAAGELRESIGLPLSPKDRGVILSESRPARTALGESTFETEYAAGKMMNDDEAVRFALETTARQ
jgi:predicted ATPase